MFKVLITTTTHNNSGVATSIVEFDSIQIARSAIEVINDKFSYGYTQEAILLNERSL